MSLKGNGGRNRLGLSTAERQRACKVNDVWSWDFVEDQTEKGTRFRILTLIDEHTRQCLAIHAAWSIRAVEVITVVEAVFERYGRPRHLRSDNAPEFIAYAIGDCSRCGRSPTGCRAGCKWSLLPFP